MQEEIVGRVQGLRERIAAAAGRAGRVGEAITLLGVSKRQPVAAVRAALAAGITAFGENYVQEGREKIEALGPVPGVRWHLIGNLQANKVRRASALFSVIQTVDRLTLAQVLSREATKGEAPLEVLVEVNLAGSTNRTGVAEAEALALCEQVAALPSLKLTGLMGVSPLGADGEAARPHFARLRQLFEALPAENRLVLSMGMSQDFEAAILEGATLVRIGTALFGNRESA